MRMDGWHRRVSSFALALLWAGCGGGAGLASRELRDVEATALAPESGAYTASVVLPFD